jgi:biotin operon repressor
VSGPALAAQFGVSLRTVYRDLRTLELAEVPLLAEHAVGYSLVEGYRLPPVMVTREEATALLTAEKLAARLTDAATARLSSAAMDKLRAVLRRPDRDHLATLAPHIQVLGPRNQLADSTTYQQLVTMTGVPFTRMLVPPTNPTAAEQAFLASNLQRFTQRSAYVTLQAREPNTLAPGLRDSPAGLAAWLLDKFRAWSDSGGNMESRFSKDELLTNLTIYWATNTIGSSFAPYHQVGPAPQGLGTPKSKCRRALSASPTTCCKLPASLPSASTTCARGPNSRPAATSRPWKNPRHWPNRCARSSVRCGRVGF